LTHAKTGSSQGASRPSMNLRVGTLGVEKSMNKEIEHIPFFSLF